MSESALLSIDGCVERPLTLRFEQLAAFAADDQVADISQFDPKRRGSAVRLAALLRLAGVRDTATHVTLHASADDFHASIPLELVRERGLVIYRLGDGSLPSSAGGPLRFLIPDSAACKSAEIDECANVKFVDRIELCAGKGFDNRPIDERDHAALHERQQPRNDSP